MKVKRGLLLLIVVLLFSAPAFSRTWYIRPDGGTRYSANVTSGQCDGKSDIQYSGRGVNQHCAFNDFRYLWDDQSGHVGAGAWVISGGDTVIVRGCSASKKQSKLSFPDCRIGWDGPTGELSNSWCYGVGSYTCYNPPIPAGSAAQHTRILGENYATCNAGGATDPRTYRSRLTHLFGGYSLNFALNLQNTQYVDIQCIELTTHNGACTRGGAPAYPRNCRGDQPLDDYAQNGILLSNKTANLTLQDVYVHGFNSSGLHGPIGGPITLTRLFVGFNGFAGWNFDDGSSTPDGPGSSIAANYVSMVGNGCYEEYPLAHSFPARVCYDDNSNGFGDAWSGQDTDLDSFSCDHCVIAYNTKDAFLGPHTNIRTLTITDSQSYGNMGAQWKWINAPGGRVVFINNLTVGNCGRFSETIPGAAQSFDKATGKPGAYLSSFCRAGGNTVALNSQQNSVVLFANNTFINADEVGFLLGCGSIKDNRNHSCGSTKFIFTNNIFLGYHMRGGQAPALFYLDDPSIKITQSHNLEYGNRAFTGGNCHDNICADPQLVNEPGQQAWATQTFLDRLEFYPAPGSPAIGRGITVDEVKKDFFSKLRPTPPTIGAVEPNR